MLSLRGFGGRKRLTGWPMKAGLTSAEIAHGDLGAKEKAERVQIPATLRSTKAKAGKADSCAQGDKDEEVDANLPPSTAQPRLEDSGSMERDAREGP
jgi:hypothetical protein